jgi:hypothetical protein
MDTALVIAVPTDPPTDYNYYASAKKVLKLNY